MLRRLQQQLLLQQSIYLRHPRVYKHLTQNRFLLLLLLPLLLVLLLLPLLRRQLQSLILS